MSVEFWANILAAIGVRASTADDWLSSILPPVRLARSPGAQPLGGEGIIYGNSGLHSLVELGLADAVVPASICLGWKPDAANRDRGDASPMLAPLVRRCCPSAIVWRVVSTRVKSVYGVARRWLLPHIGQECREIIQPAVAHFDSAPTPTGKVFVGRAVAARFHSEPSAVFGCGLPTALAAVLHRFFSTNLNELLVAAHKGSPFSSKAATRFGAALREV